MGRAPAIFGFVMTAAVIALGVVVALQHHELRDVHQRIADLQHEVRQLEARRPPAPVEPPPPAETRAKPPEGPGFLDRLAELPKNISASRLLESRRDPSAELAERLQLTGDAAEAVASVLDQESAEWVRWVDRAREEGVIDETTYAVFLADLMRRTDMQIEDLLDEAQRALYDAWRDEAFAIEEP